MAFPLGRFQSRGSITTAQRKGLVVGKDEVLRKFNREVNKLVGNIDAGLALFALKVRGKAQEYTPVDKSILINSAFTITPKGVPGKAGGGFPAVPGAGEASANHGKVLGQQSAMVKALNRNPLRSVAQVGFSAVYALAVHENPNVGRNNGGSKGWKFLERAAKEGALLALPIIASKAKV